jgi:outer membrane protein OmpA-like peptidoglycan-associated protein
MDMRFGSWLKWAPLTAAPLLAAAWLNTDSLEKKLADRAAEALKGAGAEWAALTLDGRDAVLSGEGPSAEAIDAAAKAVAGTRGIRVVDVAALKVAEALAPPAVTAAVTNVNPPEIKGTWPETLAKSLMVTLNGKSYTLGTDAELTSDGSGNWTLKPAEALADGDYDVSAEITDKFARAIKSAVPGKIVIDTVAPAAPTFNPVIGAASPTELTGTWAEGDAKDLKVTVGGKTYAAGSDPALSSLNGAWTLKLPEALPEGATDVTVESADPAGNIAAITAKGGVVVDSQAPNAPTVDSYAGPNVPSAITGTWAEGDAQSLNVTAGGTAYTYRTYQGLTTANGKWRLTPVTPLAEGVTEITVETADRAGNVSKGSGRILVDSTPPAPPIVDTPKTATTPDKITGSWDEKAATALKVIVDGTAYIYRTYTGLTSANGRWTLKPATPLTAGEHSVTVETTDAAGNVSSASGTITVDATPPATPTIDSIVSKDPVNAITGTWAEGDAASLKVTVDNRQYLKGTYTGLTSSAGKWTLQLPDPLVEGTHNVTVETADPAGNVSTAAGAVTIDRTPPASATLDVTMSSKPIDTLTGGWAGKDAQSLKVTVDGSDYILRTYTGLSSSAGKWTLKLPAPLAEGTHSVAIETADAAGNVSRNTGDVIVDMTAPATPAISQTVFKSSPPAITGTWAEGDGKSLRVILDGSQYVKGTYTGLTSAKGKWSLNLPAALAEGSYNIAVETADSAGNASSAKGIIIVDQTAPAAATLDAALSKTPIDMLSGTWAEKDAQSLKIVVDGSSYLLRTFSGLRSIAGQWSLKLPTPLGEGEHAVSVETADAAGNISVSTGKAVIDSQAPAAPSVDKQLVFAPIGTITGTWAEGDAQSLKVTVGGGSYVFRTYNGLTSLNGKWRLNLAAPLAKGAYDVTVDTADAMGNPSSVTVPGAIVVEAMPDAPTVARTEGSNPRPLIAGTWDAENSTGLSVSVGGRTYTKGIDGDLTVDNKGWVLTPAGPLKDGIYDVVAAAVTSRGDMVKDNTVAEVEIDTTGPQAPTVNKAAVNNAMPAITGTVGAGTKELFVALAGRAYTLGTDAELTSDGAAWSLKPASALKDGIYDVVVTAADTYGNTSKDTTVAEIEIDTTGPQAPTVNVVAGNNPQPAITGTVGSDAKSFAVTVDGQRYTLGQDQQLTADGAGNWTLSPSTPLPEGVHDVEAVAADALGNKSSDASSAEITVDLTGPEAPTVNPLLAQIATPEITGTIGKETVGLNVTLDGRTYVLGTDQNLKLDGSTWSLIPTSPLGDGAYDVVATAADNYGNTTNDQTQGELQVAVPPPQLTTPTVAALASTVARPKITGTWPSDIAKTLKVTLNGVTYELGTDDALTTGGSGNWALASPPLKDGVYDVAVAVSNDAGSASDTTKDELVIDAAGPATPTVKLYSSDKSPATISGTWAEGDAVNLSVTLNGKAALLGTDGKLQSDGKGNWTLSVDETLPPGSYDVAVSTADKAGRSTADQTKFEILVKQIVAAQTPPEPTPPADCGVELSKLLIVDPITFNSDRAAIRGEENGAIEKIAQVMGTCPDSKFEIAGHTDWVGSNPFNQALSERRAVAVRRALIKRGIEAGRLAAEGYGEAKPLASNETPEGRSLNRRIEITVVK